MINVVFKETEKELKSKVFGAVAGYINKLLFRKKSSIIRDIKGLMPGWVQSQPEMQELMYNDGGIGSLGAQLGLPVGTGPAAVNAITVAMVNSISLDISKINKRTLAGGITAKFMPATFVDLLSLPEGTIRTELGTELPWLNWLLTEGFSVIVVGYKFNFRRGGRSQGGYMTEGGIWRVPPKYAGTKDDNFITRALTGKKNEQQISEVFKRHIKS